MFHFDEIGQVFVQNVLPMLLIAAIGCIVQWRLRLDITTLNRLNMYVFVPGLLFGCLMDPGLTWDTLGTVAAICGGHQVVMLLAGWGLSHLSRFDRETSATVSLAGMSGNSGNFGIPLIALAFAGAGDVIQAIVLAVSNLACYTLGIAAISAGKKSLSQALVTFLKLPIPYVLAAALILRSQYLDVPEPVATSVAYLKDGLIPVALVTLGAQLVSSKGSGQPAPLGLASLLRLLVSPALMFGLLYVSGTGGLMGQVLFVGAAVPAAVNTVVLAVEFDNRPSLAAHIVLVTTLLSALTVSVALYVARTRM